MSAPATALTCSQPLGMFQSFLKPIQGALSHLDQCTQVGKYTVLDRDTDPQFPGLGSVKKIYFCVSIALSRGEFSIFIASRSEINCDQFQKEKQVFSLLKDVKGVVQPLLIETVGNFEYLITELFNKGELYDSIVQKSLNPKEFHLLSYSMISTLIECHKKGVIHRDLKPENYLVRQLDDGSYEVALNDFGMAYLLQIEEKVEAVRSCGSPLYVSVADWNEINGSGNRLPADYSSDAWSLGAIFYAMAIGELPGELKKETPVGYLSSEIIISRKPQFLGIELQPKEKSFLGVFDREIKDLVYSCRKFAMPSLDSIQERMKTVLERTYPSCKQVEDLPVSPRTLRAVPKWEQEEVKRKLSNAEKPVPVSPKEAAKQFWDQLTLKASSPQ